MNIQKVKRAATVRGGDGWGLEGNFFLRPQAEEHTGRELLLDVLNSRAVFIACEDLDTGELIFLNKTRIMCLELRERDLLEETTVLPQIGARVEMTSGEVLEGSFFQEMPPERSRLSDYLNFTPQFIYLCRDDGDVILNKAFVLSARERTV